eukprot:TRINITY_DN18508_c0_g1_i1.p1 TRINITY_DN18508_c0_g1~~TRINITY_DN18508_c0_g1_i1.p1  ORF type:complete len:122 (-),score=25.87 TRINITY_DN18508_c0_g1_i1:5221-5586(-)
MIQNSVNTSIASAFSSMGITGWPSHTALSTFSSPSSPTWFIDAEASNHMTSVAHSLKDLVPYVGHEQIMASNGQTVSISGIGSIGLSTPQNQSLNFLKFSSCLTYLQIWFLLDNWLKMDVL